jgi:hypothetical protein
MELLPGLTELMDALVAEDTFGYSDPESIENLHRQLARLESFVTKATADFDAANEWAPTGAKNAAAWLATRCSLPKGVARARVALGRRLRDCPRTAEAWADGDITGAQATVITKLRRPGREELFERDEGLLVDQASTLRFESFTRAAAYWEQRADPDGAEERAHAQTTRRDVWLEPSFQGMFLGKMTMTAMGGAIVSTELRRIEEELFEADWKEAADRLGRDPRPDELGRTGAQRRHDALVEMATRSASAPPDARRPAPLVSVFVDYETLHGRICQLAQGTVISPGELLPWLDQALVERAVFSTPKRVEVSHTARLYSGATRRGIELRDRQCQHQYCDEGIDRCEVDHISTFADGGPTTQENGRLLCGFHNRLRNKRPPPDRDDPDDSPPEQSSS